MEHIDHSKEQFWFRLGLVVFSISFLTVLVSRSGFFYEEVFRFGDEKGNYNRYDVARIGLLIEIVILILFFSALLIQALRNRSHLWFEKLPSSWRGRTFRQPAGTHFYASTCLFFFCTVPIASIWLNLDRYMGGDVCYKQERVYTGWKGHLFHDTPGPGYSRCEEAEGADISYGKSMDYLPIVEPWGLLILSFGISLIFALLLLGLYSRDNPGKFIRKLTKLIYLFDLRSAALTKLPKKWEENQRNGTLKYDAFLSYSHSDKDIAKKLHEKLTNAGLKVWFDTKNVGGGENFVSKIQAGLLTSKWLVPICSNEFMRSEWGRRELLSALLIENELGVEMVIPMSHNSSHQRIAREFVELERRSILSLDESLEDSVIALKERMTTNQAK